MDGCTLIYEYTGSCSKEYYQKYVRPFMGLAHKAFSGRWCLDYGHLPQLSRRITTIPCTSDLLEKQQSFKNACLMSQKAHVNVAKKLVPEGASLLKEAKHEGISMEQVQPHHYRIYDFFFLVHRTRVSFTQFEQSMMRRIEAISDDLKACPLPPLASITTSIFCRKREKAWQNYYRHR